MSTVTVSRAEGAPSGAQQGGTQQERLRFPRACRLRRRAEFARVFQDGIRLRGRLILIVAAPRLNPGPARLGLSVGRKFSRSAVTRNRTKRVLREAFRHLRHEAPEADLVLIPIAKPQAYAWNLVRDDLMTLLRRLARKLPCESS